MMKAAIFYTAGKVGVEEKPIPKPGSKDVIVKNIRSGICGSDVTCFKFGGKYVGISDNAEFGHEMAGVVHEVGSEVEGIRVGMRVFLQPMTAAESYFKTMMVGGFSQYAKVHNAKMGYNLFELPESVSFDDAALIEPLSVATHGKNIPKTKPGDNVLIYGAGTIGLGAMAAAINKGVKNPVIVDLDDHRLELAKEIGGIPFNPKSGDIKEFLSKHFGIAKIRTGETPDVDVFIEAAGAPTIFDEVMSMIKPGARYSQIAVPKEPVSFNLSKLMSTEAVLMGSCGYNNDDIYEVIDHLEGKRTKINKIITHHFPLDQIAEAFSVAIDPAQSIKVIIDMDA